MDEDIITFKATITFERYYNEDSCWGVYGFYTYDSIPSFKQADTSCNGFGVNPFGDINATHSTNENKKFSSLVGKMQNLSIGAEYEVRATFKHDNKYGDQYCPISVYALIPQSPQTQVMFLKSIIPEAIADELIKAYPNVVEDVVGGTLSEIDYSKVKGIKEFTWNRIKDKIFSNYIISDIIMLLKPIGVTYVMIKKLLQEQPNPSLLKQELLKNPYLMTKVDGIGFKKCDELALKLKPEMLESAERLTAFIAYYFKELGENEGHTWVSKSILLSEITNNVPECQQKVKDLLENNSFLYQEGEKIGLLYYKNVEKKIVDILKYKSTINTRGWFSDEQIAKAIKSAEDEQGFIYTAEQNEVIHKSLTSTVSIITGKAGCVDCDTEFFNGMQWKRIADYNDSDSVLQYNEDGTASLVKPISYIKQPSDMLYHFETKYGLSQTLSLNHNVIYVSLKGKTNIEPFNKIKEKQEKSGFYGRFITSFNYSGKGIDLSDDQIRLMIAIFADGHFCKYSKDKNSKIYKKVRLNLKKQRKKDRLEEILNRLNLPYEKKESSVKGYHVYNFTAPLLAKTFPCEWYNCSHHQLEIISDEIMKWDGYCSRNNRYSTSIKSDADFCQFVFSALGYRATIIINDRTNQKYKTHGKDYIRKSIDYSVSYTKQNLVGMCADNRVDHCNTQIVPYSPKDGLEYCFTVPSHMLILRNNNKIFITGNCGKTTIMKAIIKAFSQSNKSITTCALSAMAAQRITEATNFPASTIHRALGCQGVNKFLYNKDNQLITDVAFMDEGSMVNANLFLSWLEAIRDNTRIIIAGDHKQLPPIGFGNIFSDIIEALDKENVNQLTKPMRQAQLSGILSDANLIRDNLNPISETLQPKLIHGELQDMYYMFRTSRQQIFDTALKLYMSAIKSEGVDNVAIVSPRKQGCLNSTTEFNKIIQENLLGNEKQEISNPRILFKLGAKVMQTVNDYEKNVFNGEIGYITKISSTYEGKKKVNFCEVTYKDLIMGKDKIISYPEKELDQLDLAYALTCHKLQGGSRKTIIGVLDNTHYQLLDNCMLYTLITRAKKRCCLVAEPQAFMKCINTSHNQRNTWIKAMSKNN